MTGLDLYSKATQKTSTIFIEEYSTSFGLATRLLKAENRQHIQNIYALVRLADEIVDGVATEAGLPSSEIENRLTELETETYRAIGSGFSVNPVVHSFAITAGETGIGNEIIEPFFKSMRMDISKKKFNKKDFDEYVYGSAEVVGLMCLTVFISGIPQTEKERLTLVRGARALGAAFQKVNFLRDLKADEIGLGRTYFPGIALDKLSDLEKNKLCDDIDNDLEIAAATIPMLPSDSARAVKLAYSLFQGLNNRIRNQPIQKIKENRIRVPNFEKLLILFRVMVGLKNG